ncbi:hypothetical protein ACFUTV_26795 [Streptomyces sp. NPDC057298]|uniref:hypothetical protein n=1 Tax=Streptomyces sp. NPDC057298 TaxID=3346091 RepID=UPI0036368D39
MRTKPIMRNKMLRSVLVAAFSAVVAFGALSGVSDVKGDAQADSYWPAVPVAAEAPGDSFWPKVTTASVAAPADSFWPRAATVAAPGDSYWPVAPTGPDDSVWA